MMGFYVFPAGPVPLQSTDKSYSRFFWREAKGSQRYRMIKRANICMCKDQGSWALWIWGFWILLYFSGGYGSESVLLLLSSNELGWTVKSKKVRKKWLRTKPLTMTTFLFQWLRTKQHSSCHGLSCIANNTAHGMASAHSGNGRTREDDSNTACLQWYKNKWAFQLMVWLCVSEIVDHMKLTKETIELVTSGVSSDDQHEVASRGPLGFFYYLMMYGMRTLNSGIHIVVL